MTQTTQFTIGAEASARDGVCGVVSRVVIDPVAQTLTHLVVQPEHHHGLGRLVPVDLLDGDAGHVRLRCTVAEFGKLDPAQESHFLSGSDGYRGYGPGQVLSWPYYGADGGAAMGMGSMGLGMGGIGAIEVGAGNERITEDTLPLGQVAIRRDDQVHATDGDIGRVQGLVITAANHHVTHVLLQEGHFWGRKQVAIPISAVTAMTGVIELNISKQQVEALPPVQLDQASN